MLFAASISTLCSIMKVTYGIDNTDIPDGSTPSYRWKQVLPPLAA
jgi:hypothetical protein